MSEAAFIVESSLYKVSWSYAEFHYGHIYPLNSYVARVTCFQPNVLPVIGLLCNHMQSKAELETNGFSK